MKTPFPLLPYIVLTTVFLAVGAFSRFDLSRPVPLGKDIDLLAWTIHEWEGEAAGSFENPFEGMGADEELLRKYTRGKDDNVILYIGYFRNQAQGKELVQYRTDRLHQRSEKVKIDLSPVLSFQANRVQLSQSGRTYAALFWYEIMGRKITGRKWTKTMTIMGYLAGGRTNGTVFLVAVPEEATPSDGSSTVLAVDFLKDVYPSIQDLLPNEN